MSLFSSWGLCPAPVLTRVGPTLSSASLESSQALLSVSTDPTRNQGPGGSFQNQSQELPQDCLWLLESMSSPPHPRSSKAELAMPPSFPWTLTGLRTQQSGNGPSQLQKWVDFCPFEHWGGEQHNLSLPSPFAYGEPHVPGGSPKRAGGLITPRKGEGQESDIGGTPNICQAPA